MTKPIVNCHVDSPCALGGDDNLQIKVFTFRPKVQCYGSIDRQVMIASCDNIVNEMDASSSLTLFQTEWSPDPIVSLPYTKLDAGKLPKALNKVFRLLLSEANINSRRWM